MIVPTDYTNRYIHYIYLGIVIIIAALLRIYDLKGESYWYDEIITLKVVSGDLKSILNSNRPQLFLIIAHFWTKIFGISETATRSLSSIFGTLAIPLLYLVGKELFNKRVGLIASLLMTVSQFQIYYSQEFRYYSLYALTTLISFYSFIIYLKKPKTRWLILYIISTIVMFYSHDFGLFSLAAQALYYLIIVLRRKKIDYHLLIGFLIVSIPITLNIIRFISKVVPRKGGFRVLWLAEPPMSAPLVTLRNYIGAGLDYPSILTIYTGLIFLCVGLFIYINREGINVWLRDLINIKNYLSDSFNNKETVLTVLWLMIPILIPFVISITLKPIFHFRYTIGAAPAFYILLAVFICSIRRIIPQVITLGMIMIILAPGLYEFYKTPVREQWRETAQLIKQKKLEDDILIFNNDYNNINNFKWYYKDNFDSCVVYTHKKYTNFLKSLKRCTDGKGRFWLIIREVPYPFPEKFRSKLSVNHTDNLLLIKQYNFTKITVYLFEIRDD